MVVGDLLLRFVGTYVTAIASWSSVLWIRREFIASAFRQEIAFFDEHSPQSLAATFASDPTSIKGGINVVNSITQSICTVIVCFVFAFRASAITSSVVLGVCIIPMIATTFLCVRYKRISKVDYFKEPNASAAELFTSIETIIRLMERFYDPTSGFISIGDVPISSFPVEKYHNAVRLVGQEPVLFNMTIAENILVGLGHNVESEKATDLMIKAARRAHAHEFIMKFPDGYDQMVGEKGARLSGGQKQRIAIARALIASPKILLLDEATSALDTKSERAVQQSLEEILASHECTAIVVAHRLSTIVGADQIVVMDGGRIVETGNHIELMNLGGVYASMVQKQRIE